MKILLTLTAFWLFASSGVSFSASRFNPEMTAFVEGLEKQAHKDDSSFKGFDAERGRKIFFEEHPNEKLGKISCATCHTSNLKNQGKTTAGKAIEPLAPSANSKRLTNVKDVEKWLLRNFKQVLNREGTAHEKGDALMFISSQ